MRLIDRAALCDTPILLVGESGTGKELLARALHSKSPRALGPFLAVNCFAIHSAQTGGRRLADVEREHILRTLRAVEGNKASAARVLGLNRKTLYRKLTHHRIPTR
jgi:DNA-binding NtrC family response regulator